MFQNLKEDLKRLREHQQQSVLRTFIAGLLSPGFQAIVVYRFFSWCDRKGIPTQPFRYFVERIVEITTGISIPAKCTIGKGLRIHHFGNIIFHSTAEIGDFCTVYHEVTIGDRGGYGRAARIGKYVMIGAGAKIIGNIEIGDNCIVGANTVVNKDMQSNITAYGNPAKFKPRRQSQGAALDDD